MNTLEGTIKEAVYTRLGLDLTCDQYDAIPSNLFDVFCGDELTHEAHANGINAICEYFESKA